MASSRSFFKSGPLMITARSADDPVAISVEVSMIGCVKLSVAPGIAARSFQPRSSTRSRLILPGGHLS